MLNQLFLTPITRSIPELPEGAVMFSWLHALYNENIHRTALSDTDRITGMGQYVVERLHITAHVCNSESKKEVQAHVILSVMI